MSVQYCHDCDKHIDMDYNAEHFDEPKECKPEKSEESKEV